MKIPEYQRGYNDATGEIIAWLQARAQEMNDPHARGILNGAAFGLGLRHNTPEAKALLFDRSHHNDRQR